MPDRIRLTQTTDGVTHLVAQLDALTVTAHVMSPDGVVRTDNKAEGIKLFCEKVREFIDSLEHQVSD